MATALCTSINYINYNAICYCCTLLLLVKLGIRWQSQRKQRILGMPFLVEGKIFSRCILPNDLDLCCLVLGTRDQEVPESGVPGHRTRSCYGNNCSPNR